jgi:ribosomal protein S12 methylthiotransferase accessory factor
MSRLALRTRFFGSHVDAIVETLDSVTVFFPWVPVLAGERMVSSTARSMRSSAPEETLLYARQWAATAGISEVRDITDLDVLDVPVFVSVRPQARGESFTFGKGLRHVDAEVGAYMEALEFFFAEPGAGSVSTYWGSARNVAGQDRVDAILDFVPLLQREVDLDGPLLLASVRDIESGDERAIPAELIYYPAPDCGQSLFGSSTNGLASGNSLLEASIQALLELIERRHLVTRMRSLRVPVG